MKTVKHTSTFYIVIAVLGILLYLLDSTGIFTLAIGTAHPLLLLALLVAVAMNAREWAGLVFGALFGILLDITTANSYCFNLITLAIIGCICGLICSYFINNNIYSALVLSLLTSVAYFTLKWLLFTVPNRGSFSYFINHSLISAAYTALFIIPFYYLVRFLSKKTNYII